MTNEWMNDPSLQEIAPYKLQFLQALIFESASLSREQMMPFLMAVMKRGKEKTRNSSPLSMFLKSMLLRKN